MQARNPFIPGYASGLTKPYHLPGLLAMSLCFSGLGGFCPADAHVVSLPDSPAAQTPMLISQGFSPLTGPAPVMPANISQPGAPPPAIMSPGGSTGEFASPVQPGVPTMQPSPAPTKNVLVPPPPSQSAPAVVGQPAAPSINQIAPSAEELQTPVTLFENQQPSANSGAWGDILSGSITKVRTLPIDLSTVLKLVETQNLPLAQNRLTAKIDNVTYYRSLVTMLPDIQGTYVQSRFQGSILVFGNNTVPTYQTRIVPQLTASWTINPGGQDFFLALAAKQRAKGAKFAVLDTLNNQLMTAANLYYDLLSSNAQVENAKLSIQETESQVKLNEARMKAGIGTKLDLETARSQLVFRQQILIDAENTLARTQQALLNVLNLDPEVELSPAQNPVQARPLVPFDVTTAQLLARALKNNPSLQISAMELRALKDEARATLGAIVPSVTMQTYIGGLGPQWDQLGLTRFGGFTLQTNLFSKLGTAIPLDYTNRRLAVSREVVIRQQQIRDLQTQVINAYLDSRSSVKAIMAAQEQLSVAQEAYRLAFGRFQAGLGINVELLNAQTALAAARTTVVRAILSFNQAQVRLLNALGDSSTQNIINGIPVTVFPKSPTTAKP
jgi:outer membrane protein